MIAPLAHLAGDEERVLVGPESADDAGVYSFAGRALVATADFITPVCDDPELFGRIAAANSLSDLYAMGAQPLFALNLCCFPETDIPEGVLAQILGGAAKTLAEAGAVLLGGHTVGDPELKFGLAAIGQADPDRLLRNRGAIPGDLLVMTKPLGTGVLVNAFKFDKLSAEGLAPALAEMARLNAEASQRALDHEAHAATDVTGFGLAGHAMNLARQGDVELVIDFERLPVWDEFYPLFERGITTGCSHANRENLEGRVREKGELTDGQRALLYDPQTSGGLLIALPPEGAEELLAELLGTGHLASVVGEVRAGEPRLTIKAPRTAR